MLDLILNKLLVVLFYNDVPLSELPFENELFISTVIIIVIIKYPHIALSLSFNAGILRKQPKRLRKQKAKIPRKTIKNQRKKMRYLQP